MAKYRVHFQTKDKEPVCGWRTYEANSFEEAEEMWNTEYRFDRTKQLNFTELV